MLENETIPEITRHELGMHRLRQTIYHRTFLSLGLSFCDLLVQTFILFKTKAFGQSVGQEHQHTHSIPVRRRNTRISDSGCSPFSSHQFPVFRRPQNTQLKTNGITVYIIHIMCENLSPCRYYHYHCSILCRGHLAVLSQPVTFY